MLPSEVRGGFQQNSGSSTKIESLFNNQIETFEGGPENLWSVRRLVWNKNLFLVVRRQLLILYCDGVRQFQCRIDGWNEFLKRIKWRRFEGNVWLNIAGETRKNFRFIDDNRSKQILSHTASVIGLLHLIHKINSPRTSEVRISFNSHSFVRHPDSPKLLNKLLA